MEFNIKKTVLVEEIRMVNRAIENNPSFPIMTNVLIKIDETGMSLIGSNGDLTIETFYEIEEESELEVISSGTITLPAKKFFDVIRSLPGQEVNISMEEDNNRVNIRSGKSRFTLVGESSDQYPLLPKVKDSQSLNVSTEAFVDMLNTTGYAISKSDTRPILTGVNLFFDGNTVGAVSTDAHRLARAKGVAFEGNGFDYSVTIPAKTVKELPSLLTTSKSKEIKVQTDGSQFIVQGEGITTYTRIQEGSFPDTNRLVPNDFNTEVVLNRYELLSALQRVSILSNQSENSIIELEIDSESMFESILLSSNDQEIGSSREEVLIDKMDGEDLKISFNVHYMIEALKNIDSKVICIGFSGEMKPFIITPFESEVDTLKLILPVRTY